MRNISPIPPPSIAATVELDRDIVLPTLEPILSLVSLPEASDKARELIAKKVRLMSMKHTWYRFTNLWHFRTVTGCNPLH